MTRALVLMFLVTGCGAADEPIETDVISLDEKADNTNSAKKALPDGSSHVYFSSPASVYVSDDAPLSYTWFTANKNHEFKIVVGELDENGNAIAGEHIGFKLQRAVKKHGKWSWSVVAQADSDDGIAGVKYQPKTGPGLYLVTATASPLPAQLTINLGCGDDGCATAQEPGEACGGFAAGQFRCDDGLYCQYTIAQQCGAGDQQGVCAIKSGPICPLFYNPICGCDGQTYGNGCEAGSAGTSIVRVGSCDVDIVGSWGYIDGAHYGYTFAADGTFTSTAEPACRFTPPFCGIMTREETGTYHVTTTTLSLNYSNGNSALFSIDASQTHLTGTDFGASLDLTRTQ